MADPALRTPFVASEASAGYDHLGVLPVRVVLHDVRSLYNVGAFFRTADAVGVGELWLSGITGAPPQRAISKTALGAEEHVRWRVCADLAADLEGLRAADVELAAVETMRTAVDLFDWHPRFPVALVFGHEVEGSAIRPSWSPDATLRCRLPMRGVKHSLNVATAGGVVLYELLRKYRRPRPAWVVPPAIIIGPSGGRLSW